MGTSWRFPGLFVLAAISCALGADGSSGRRGMGGGGIPRTAHIGATSIYAPKTECLSWLNELVGSDYTKVEQCANGAAFCQVMDRLYAGEFPIKKVSIKSHPTSQDSLRNYKLLQQFFKAKGIEKTFDISKLTNAKPMDNLEFLQWVKWYYDSVLSGGGGSHLAVGSSSNMHNNRGSYSPPPQSTPGARRATTATPRGRGEALSTYAGTPTRDIQARAAVEFTPSRREDTRQIDALREQTAALESTVVELEKERDFYYGKLRAVELLCQATEEDGGVMPGALGIARDILELMYRDTPGVEEGEEV